MGNGELSMKKYSQLTLTTHKKFRNVQNVEVSDTTGDAQRSENGIQIFITKIF